MAKFENKPEGNSLGDQRHLSIAFVNLPRVFVVESHDVHHLVFDVAHKVCALGDGDLQVDSVGGKEVFMVKAMVV